ncbi:MAG: hypothetical protein HRU20_18540 [Pseudomonadales bacterium]|nr:hypothetical protein [Pseudomonadales bacterium]
MKYYKGLLTALVLSSTPALAVDYNFGGYVSVVAGGIIDGDKSGSYLGEELGYDCPCFVADYTNAGVYEDDGISFKPDSGYGFNAQVSFNEALSITAQIEGKGGNDFEAELSWLFLRWNVTNKLSIDIGRKALPLYFYSDFINVGYAYPWIRPTGDIYGWPLSSYNGISASFTDDLGDGSYTLSAWYGREEDDDNRAYNDIYWGAESYYIEWSDILGGSFEYNYDWLTLRAVVMSNTSTEDAHWAANDIEPVSDNVDQIFYGFAALIDYNDVLLQAEYNQFDADDFDSKGYLLALGYRINNFTPMISFSRYSDNDPDFGNDEQDGHQVNNTLSYSLRWDFMRSTAFTVQYDVLTDNTVWFEEGEQYTFTGDSKLLAMGVDYVF